jgi:colicin import membrane protein
MAKKLKSYQTSIGFFDLAIAAPSMKAALEAWGADSNLFHQGFAREAEAPDIVAATLKHPGVVLRRPVGSKGAFKENADLPKDVSSTTGPSQRKLPPAKQSRRSGSKKDGEAARKASAAFEREQRKRDADARKEEAHQAKKLKRRNAAMAAAQKALDLAEQAHGEKAAVIAAERKKLDTKAQAEDTRWDKQKSKLEAALRKAKSGR